MWLIVNLSVLIGVYFLMLMPIVTHRKNTLFLKGVLIYYIFYDFIFINLIDIIGENIFVTSLKLVYELILALMLILFISGDYEKKQHNILYAIIIYGISLSLINGHTINNILSGIRMFIEPIIAGYLFYANGFFNKINFKSLFRFFAIILIILFLFSVYQAIFYNRETDLWFYNYMTIYKDLDIERSAFNYFRNDGIRASSFFVSPIDASILFAYFFMFFYVFCKKSFFSYLLMGICLFAIYLTRTRIGLLCVSIFVGVLLTRKLYRIHIYIPIFLIITTFWVILFGYSDEPSALGRIPQYVLFGENFKLGGYGIGNEDSLVYYDSYFISIIYAFGIIGSLMFVLWGKLFFICQKYIENNKTIFFAYCLILCSIYISVFQFYAGSSSYKFFIIICFFSISQLKKYKV